MKKKLLKFLIVFILTFLTLDIVKGILPFTCSLPGHYHFIGYEQTTSTVAQGIRYQSGRPYLNYSGGKQSCPLKFSGTLFGIINFIYNFLLSLASFLLALPSYAFEMLIGSSPLCSIIRILNALAVLIYLSLSIMYFYLTNILVLDLSETEINFLKNYFYKKSN